MPLLLASGTTGVLLIVPPSLPEMPSVGLALAASIVVVVLEMEVGAVRLFRGRQSLLLENLALRQQLVALKRRHPRPSLGLFDKLFWVAARRFRSEWKQSLILVTPETVVRWSTPVLG